MRELLNRNDQVKPVENLLDIGCGDGTKTSMYAQILGAEVIRGVDLSDESIKKASKQFPVKKVDMECDTLPYQDESFDFVICDEVLEHLKNIFWALGEADRVLKTGGHLLITVPNLAALHNRILLFFGRQPICVRVPGPHIRGFTHSEFRKLLLSNSNFYLVDGIGSSLYPIPPPLSEFLAKLFPGISAYVLYLLKKKAHFEQASQWLHLTEYGDSTMTHYRTIAKLNA